MPRTVTVAPAQELFETIVKEFVSDTAGIVRGQMMGMPCLKVRGKMFAGYWRDAMVFKLAGAAHAQAMELKGAHLFDPSDMNRPMKEWVVLPFTHKAKWRVFTESALLYVSTKT
jgi:hypothetical protein